MPPKEHVDLSHTTLIHHDLDVKSWTKIEPDVEGARPSHCGGCEAPARRGGGLLRLHGHGTRVRTLWGPTWPELGPGLVDIAVRRYRCVDCRAVRTVVPRGVAQLYRYTLGGIGLALTYWALWLWPAARTRMEVSPWPVVGMAAPERWRSLERWARRAHMLFGLPQSVPRGGPREFARRVTGLLGGRGPPDETELVRVFVGAQMRGRTLSA